MSQNASTRSGRSASTEIVRFTPAILPARASRSPLGFPCARARARRRRDRRRPARPDDGGAGRGARDPAAAAGRGGGGLGGAGDPRLPGGRLHATWRCCGRSQRGAGGHLRPRARADRAPARAGRRRHRHRPGPGGAGARAGQGGHARPADRARDAVPPARGRRARVADVEAFGFPCVLKTTRGGYDGKGVWFVGARPSARTPSRRPRATGVPLLAEERVDFRRELSALVARGPSGQAAAYPVVASDPARRHLPRGGRAGARPRPGPGRRRRSRSR